MATAIFRVSILATVVSILLLTIFCKSSNGIVGDNRRAGSVSGGSDRSLLRNSRIPNCSELVFKSQCSQNSKCRWCKSEVLDDMCFAKSEASRLPTQVVKAIVIWGKK